MPENWEVVYNCAASEFHDLRGKVRTLEKVRDTLMAELDSAAERYAAQAEDYTNLYDDNIALRDEVRSLKKERDEASAKSDDTCTIVVKLTDVPRDAWQVEVE